MDSFGARLRQARRRRFVGRDAELELFRAALADPPRVLFLHGPGGIGKTTLLGEFAEIAVAEGATPVRVDGAEVDPAPAALRAALTVPDHRPVLLLDTYEALAPLDPWIRERLLPALPADVLVVLAGREPPSPRWTTDPAWRDVLRVVAVRNLAPADARAYLRIEGVEPELHDRLVEITHGHPLTLSLLADAAPESWTDVPDVLRAAIERIVDDVPGARHRQALEVAAHARVTSEDLLRAVLGGDDTGQLFDWLRTRTFVEETRRGLQPHDLVRDALDADLRWRDPARYAALHRTVRNHSFERVWQTEDEREQHRRVVDALFTTRANPLIAPFYRWAGVDEAYVDDLQPGDRPALLALTGRLQGPEQAAHLARWLDAQPGRFRVFRGPDGEPIGYAGCLRLDTADPADRDADPGTRAMWAHATAQAPPRTGEQVVAWRFMLDREHHHDRSASRVLAAAWGVREILSRGPTAWEFFGLYQDAEQWAPVYAYMDFTRASAADYTVGDLTFPVFARDWRGSGVDAWLDNALRQDLGAAPGPTAPQALVLSQPEFAAAVRAALRDLRSDDRLAENPLLRSRLTGGRADRLRELIDAAAESLRPDPRLHRVLDRTFLRPAATQERAAEALHLSFSTYRRHRDRAVERVVAYLWERELHGE
ncbi:ATP-binding protein [Actinoplanes sp. NPDC024001]|uniref:ATP-binding protein n=1 Tax=Actinoplanes sp. NPDC024001 TaxID=3154598 RepID=UPI0033D9B814